MKTSSHRILASLSIAFVILAQLSAWAAVTTLAVNINGSGSVSLNPTNSVYPQGAVVTATATPSAGWKFSFWSGDANGMENPLNVTMSSNKTIIANFVEVPVYSLVVSNNGSGMIGVAGYSWPENTAVTLTAVSSSGWQFLDWGGDASGNANPLAITMVSNRFVVANFVQLPVILSQPQSQVVSLGGAASFQVTAAGTGPLFYQWLYNGAPLNLETNSILLLSNVQSAQEGSYSVAVSNRYGAALSDPAALSIANACSGTNVLTACDEATLRQAIAIGGNVRFCCNGTITLTSTISVTNDVFLDASERSVTISGNGQVRLFRVSAGATLAMTNLILAHGCHLGTNGVLATYSTPAQPPEAGMGGAIYNLGGRVQLVGCVLTNNQVRGGTGASGSQFFTNNPAGGPGRGGAIYNDGGLVLLQNVLAVSNSATGGAGLTSPLPVPGGNGEGGVVYTTGGTVFITNSVFTGNRVDAPNQPVVAAKGGAVYHETGSLVIHGSTLADNYAVGAPADMVVAGPITVPAPAFGGAVYTAGGNLEIEQSRFLRNVAQGGRGFRNSGTGEAQGGAIYAAGTNWIRTSSFSSNQALAGNFSGVNSAGRGGALYNIGTTVLEADTFEANLARGGSAAAYSDPYRGWPGGHAFGGAIFNTAVLGATNCTLALNRAEGGAAAGAYGAASGSAYGGGLYSATGAVHFMNVTLGSNVVAPGAFFDSNTAGPASGANLAKTNGTLTLVNSIVAGGDTNGNSWGALTDGGYNISSDGSCSFFSGSSFNYTNPRLEPLAHNGGPTFTMALAPDSPAIDFGGSTGAPVTDQRGVARPFGSGVDIGAYEAGPTGPSLHVQVHGNEIEVSFRAAAANSYRFYTSPDLRVWEAGELIPAQPTEGMVTRTFSNQQKRFFRISMP